MREARREHSLLGPVASYLRRRGYRDQVPEMGFFEQKIDLYAYCQKQNVTLAVELKLRRWRYALTQALLYQLCSDHVLIAMPESAMKSVDRDLLRLHGVGLIAVGGRKCRQVLGAERSSVVRRGYRSACIGFVKGVR